MTSEGSDPVWPNVDLTEAARWVRSSQVSRLELVESHLERIDRLDGVLHACITVLADQAIAAAKALDAKAHRGEAASASLLEGLPIGLKDNFKTAGIRTTAASRVLNEYVPEIDSEVVRRLKLAGAIPIAKTNMDELALGGPFGSDIAGIMVNPWDAASIPGGSSGGSAIAVASGMAMAATGSDTGGSIRNPAAWCGVIGFKPTQGVLSTDGVVPVAWSLDTAGFLAHTVADCELLLAETDQRVSHQDQAANRHLSEFAHSPLRHPLRIGIAESAFGMCEEGVHEPFADAVHALDAMGTVDEAVLPSLDDALMVLFVIAHTEAASVWAKELQQNPNLFGREIRAALDAGSLCSARDYIDAQRLRASFRESVNQLFRTFDVIVIPSLGTTPRPDAFEGGIPGHMHPDAHLGGKMTCLWSLTGNPVLSMPCGFTSTGRPVSIQIVGPAFRDGFLLRACSIAESVWALPRERLVPTWVGQQLRDRRSKKGLNGA